jgi:hypothetical protein
MDTCEHHYPNEDALVILRTLFQKLHQERRWMGAGILQAALMGYEVIDGQYRRGEMRCSSVAMYLDLEIITDYETRPIRDEQMRSDFLKQREKEFAIINSVPEW